MRKFKMILFAVCLLCLLSCSSALAATDVIASGDCGANGDNVTWELTADGVLTINGSGEMKDYNDELLYGYGHEPWAKYREDIILIKIGHGITSIGNDAFGANHYQRYYSRLIGIELPNSITKIGDYAFGGCHDLATIELPYGITTIGNGAFNGCRNLQELDLPDTVEKIGDRAFSHCQKLKKIIIPEGVTDVGEMCFYLCDNLTEVILPSSITNIGESAFDGCQNLKAISMPNGVTTIGNAAFEDCFSLENIIIPDSVLSLGDTVFQNCNSLKEITIPSSVKFMGKYAFSGCDSLQNVIMKATVTQIDVGTFQSCYNLKTVSLLGDVILIGNNAFSNCRKLESIFLPNSVTRIGNYVFDKCDSLSDIYFMGNENEWNNIIIGNYNDALLNTRIHYNSTEILPPETDVDCIMSTFAALFGDQSININVPITFIFDAQTSENTDAMGTLDFVIWAKDASGNVTSALQVQGTNVSVSDKIMNAYKVTNGKNDDKFQLSFMRAGQYTIYAGVIPENSTTISDAKLIGKIRNTITVSNTEQTNNLFIQVIVDGKVVNDAESIVIEENATIEKEITLRVFNAQGQAIIGKTVKVGTNSANISVDCTSVSTNARGEAKVKIKGNRSGNYQLYFIIDNYDKVVPVRVKKVTDLPEAPMLLSLNYGTTKAPLGSTMRLASMEWVSHNGVRTAVDAAEIGSTIWISASGNAISSFDSQTGTISIKSDKKYLDEQITVIAVSEKYKLIGIAVLDVKKSSDTTSSNGGSSSGGSSGGGSSNNNSSNISNIVVTTPDSSIKITTSSVGNQIVKDAEATVAKDEHVQVISGKNCAISISAKENGNTVTSFDDPVKVTIPVSSSAFNEVTDSSKLTLAKVTKDETGQTVFTYMGGNYDANSKTFTAYVDEPGDYILIEDSDIQKIELQIGSSNSTHNGSAIANDVAPIIYNNRTMVPLRFLAETLGAQVDWNEAARTVTLLIDGVQMSMTIDEAIEGFDTAPIIYQERTMVPIRYIAEQLNANVIYAPDTQKIIVVK